MTFFEIFLTFHIPKYNMVLNDLNNKLKSKKSKVGIRSHTSV